MREAGLLLFLCLILGGCTSQYFNKRYGLAPELDAADVERASLNKERILNALANDARIGTSSPPSYYQVVEAGLNYIDDQCSIYFDQLFFLDRNRERLKSSLSAFGQTTNAVLAVTGATNVTMAVVAQAFGLATSLTDVVAGTYLYELPPATTQSFVKQTQGAFRRDLAARPQDVATPTAAYHAIQQYLALCLPPTIEANIVKHLSSAVIVPTGRVGARFGLASETPVSAIPPAVRPVPASRPPVPASRTPVPASPPPVPASPSPVPTSPPPVVRTVPSEPPPGVLARYQALCKVIDDQERVIAVLEPGPATNKEALIAKARAKIASAEREQSDLQARTARPLTCPDPPAGVLARYQAMCKVIDDQKSVIAVLEPSSATNKETLIAKARAKIASAEREQSDLQARTAQPLTCPDPPAGVLARYQAMCKVIDDQKRVIAVLEPGSATNKETLIAKARAKIASAEREQSDLQARTAQPLTCQ